MNDLFTDVAPARTMAALERITCRVCERPAAVPIDHPALLCPLCMEDLDATASHVAERYAAVVVRFQGAWQTLEDAVAASPDRAWWNEKVEKYRARADYSAATFDAAWRAAKAAGGDKARLCGLWEALDGVAAELERIEGWYRRACAELRAARDAAGWPVKV